MLTLLSLEFHDRTNRSKNLILHDAHLWVHVSKHSRFDEVSLLSMPLSTYNNFCTLLFSRINESHDTIKLRLRYLGTVLSVRIKW